MTGFTEGGPQPFSFTHNPVYNIHTHTHTHTHIYTPKFIRSISKLYSDSLYMET
jgi:hypothetical protein